MVYGSGKGGGDDDDDDDDDTGCRLFVRRYPSVRV
jgi:hypothetical protein